MTVSLPLPVPIPAPLSTPRSPLRVVRVGVGLVVGRVSHIAPPGCDRAGRPVRVFVLCPLRQATRHTRACEPYHVRVFVRGAPLCAQVDAIARPDARVRVRGNLYLRARSRSVLQCEAHAIEETDSGDGAARLLSLAPGPSGRVGPPASSPDGRPRANPRRAPE